jgi:hypothetical protein
MYPISDELTGVAFERALGEELGYETHETQDTDKSLPETRVEDEPRIAQRHDSIFGLEVDEMPSIAVGEDANSDGISIKKMSIYNIIHSTLSCR